MSTYLLILLLSLLAFTGLAQTKTLNYQAVILNPNPLDVPGNTISNLPFGSGDVCVKFSFLSKTGQLEYQEVQCTKTDSYGLVNLNIGAGNSSGIQASNTGKYSSFDGMVWDANPKKLKVDVSFDQGKTFTAVSTQALNYSAYALYAESVEYQNVRSAPIKLSQFTDDLQVAKIKDLDPLKADIASNKQDIQGILNNNTQTTAQVAVINQSITAINKVNETQTGRLDYLNAQLAETNMSIQNLGFTYERLANRSLDSELGGRFPQDGFYPSQRAVKTYIDAQTTGNATTTTLGKIQLAGDLTGTATLPRLAANSVKFAALADSTVTTSKIVDANVTDAKIVSMQASKLTGNIAVANGGTGASSLTGILRGNGTGAFSSVAYGNFYDLSNQIAAVADSTFAMKVSNTDFASGISIQNNTQVRFTNAGVYNIQFSLQIGRSTGTSPETITYWLRKNGANISATSKSVLLAGSALVISGNFFQNLIAGDQVELMSSTTNPQVYLATTPANATPSRPPIPSLNLSVSQVF